MDLSFLGVILKVGGRLHPFLALRLEADLLVKAVDSNGKIAGVVEILAMYM